MPNPWAFWEAESRLAAWQSATSTSMLAKYAWATQSAWHLLGWAPSLIRRAFVGGSDSIVVALGRGKLAIPFGARHPVLRHLAVDRIAADEVLLKTDGTYGMVVEEREPSLSSLEPDDPLSTLQPSPK